MSRIRCAYFAALAFFACELVWATLLDRSLALDGALWFIQMLTNSDFQVDGITGRYITMIPQLPTILGMHWLHGPENQEVIRRLFSFGYILLPPLLIFLILAIQRSELLLLGFFAAVAPASPFYVSTLNESFIPALILLIGLFYVKNFIWTVALTFISVVGLYFSYDSYGLFYLAGLFVVWWRWERAELSHSQFNILFFMILIAGILCAATSIAPRALHSLSHINNSYKASLLSAFDGVKGVALVPWILACGIFFKGRERQWISWAALAVIGLSLSFTLTTSPEALFSSAYHGRTLVVPSLLGIVALLLGEKFRSMHIPFLGPILIALIVTVGVRDHRLNQSWAEGLRIIESFQTQRTGCESAPNDIHFARSFLRAGMSHDYYPYLQLALLDSGKPKYLLLTKPPVPYNPCRGLYNDNFVVFTGSANILIDLKALQPRTDWTVLKPALGAYQIPQYMDKEPLKFLVTEGTPVQFYTDTLAPGKYRMILKLTADNCCGEKIKVSLSSKIETKREWIVTSNVRDYVDEITWNEGDEFLELKYINDDPGAVGKTDLYIDGVSFIQIR